MRVLENGGEMLKKMMFLELMKFCTCNGILCQEGHAACSQRHSGVSAFVISQLSRAVTPGDWMRHSAPQDFLIQILNRG